MSTDHVILSRLTRALAEFLERELPRVRHTDWWNACVLSMLTLQQREMVSRRRITSLSGLDLSALLRTLDQNWNDLSANLNWPREVRHFIKEAQSLRNRWAHAGSEPTAAEDRYRDFDTLQRLAQAIGATDLAADIGGEKRELLVAGTNPPHSVDLLKAIHTPAASSCTG